jgi:uncharacterized protein (TIGR03435 family)
MRILILATLAISAGAQNGAPPAFDAASIKPNQSGSGHSSTHTRPGNVQMENASLRSIIKLAFEIKEYQLDAPAWIRSEHFDIVAKAPAGTPEKQLPAMMRTLLAERFKLETHRETREFPVYGLVLAKGGLKVQPVEPGGTGMDTTSDEQGGVLKGSKVKMVNLAEWMSSYVDRPVIDMTGISGAYDLTLRFSRESERSDPGKTPQYPVVPLALQEQLGLRLEKKTAPIEMLVVDRVEKVPVEN